MARPRSPLNSLAATLEESAAIVALFNEERQLTFANAACLAWLQASLEDLVGREAIYTSLPQPDPLDSIVARISPPPDCFLGTARHGLLTNFPADGATLQRTARFTPVHLGEDRFAVLVVADSDDKTSLEPPGLRSDWHAAVARMRAQVPFHAADVYLAGESSLMRRLREQVTLAMQSRCRAHVQGATGSGGDEIAAHIASGKPGRTEGIVSLNCKLQDAETLQAAIRALSRKQNGASAPPAVVLRGIDLLPESAQRELLGFMQLPGFDLRIVSTGSCPLEDSGLSGDLINLLTTLEIRIPLLAERPEDVPLLAQWVLEQHSLKSGKPLSGFVPEALEQVVAYDWRDNVEELVRLVDQACEQALGPWVLATDLPERLRSNWQQLAHPPQPIETIQLDAFLGEIEKQLLERAINQAKGNKAEAARLLGISRPRLLRRLLHLGLVAPEEAIDFQPVDDDMLGDAS